MVSIGGPVYNKIAKEINQKKLVPLWFRNLPYSKDSIRAIGNSDGSVEYQTEFNRDKEIVVDYGFVAKIKSPKNELQTIFLIAGNYGSGTLGAIKYLTSDKNLRKLRSRGENNSFQAVIKSQVVENKITYSQLVKYSTIDDV